MPSGAAVKHGNWWAANRIHLCNAYVLNPKKGQMRGSQYAILVMVAEEHLHKLQAIA